MLVLPPQQQNKTPLPPRFSKTNNNDKSSPGWSLFWDDWGWMWLPVILDLLLIEADVEVSELFDKPGGQHVVYTAVQPRVESWRGEMHDKCSGSIWWTRPVPFFFNLQKWTHPPSLPFVSACSQKMQGSGYLRGPPSPPPPSWPLCSSSQWLCGTPVSSWTWRLLRMTNTRMLSLTFLQDFVWTEYMGIII